MRAGKWIACLLLFCVLSGCAARPAPREPVLRFAGETVTLTGGGATLTGELDFDRVDGVSLRVTLPQTLQGLTLTLRGGEYNARCGEMSLSLEDPAGGMACGLLGGLRAFACASPVWTGEEWLVGTLHLQCDGQGRALALWDDKAGWRAAFAGTKAGDTP